MDAMPELVRYLDRGLPFQAVLPAIDLTELLASLASRGTLPPEIVIHRPTTGVDRVVVDFSGKTGSWTLG